MVKKLKSVLIEDTADSMTVNYRERFVVRKCSHDVVCYGWGLHDAVAASVTGAEGPLKGGENVAHARSEFDHSAGRGRYSRPGVVEDDRPKKFFFSRNVKRR